MLEADLYPPIKAFLEAQGYEVKGEVLDCDLVARRAGEAPVVVELKVRFTLDLLLQAVDRQAVTDTVYVAFAAGGATGTGSGRSSPWNARRRSAIKLCRRLGLGILTVERNRTGALRVVPVIDPQPYTPRKDGRRVGRLLKEFHERVGDLNPGGTTRRKRMTAYRQDALRCADVIAGAGEARPADVRDATGLDRAPLILQRDVYGWFERIARGRYGLSANGRAALDAYAGLLPDLRKEPPQAA